MNNTYAGPDGGLMTYNPSADSSVSHLPLAYRMPESNYEDDNMSYSFPKIQRRNTSKYPRLMFIGKCAIFIFIIFLIMVWFKDNIPIDQ